MENRLSVLRGRLRHIQRLAPVVMLRETPLPWTWKRWIIWALSPRYQLGAYVVIRDNGGRVLSLKSSYAGRWTLPGGGVNYNESFEAAARREAREELGVEVRDVCLRALLTDSSGRGLHAVFNAQLPDAPIELSEEHTDWRFLEVTRLGPFYRQCVKSTEAQAESQITVGAVDWTD